MTLRMDAWYGGASYRMSGRCCVRNQDCDPASRPKETNLRHGSLLAVKGGVMQTVKRIWHGPIGDLLCFLLAFLVATAAAHWLHTHGVDLPSLPDWVFGV